MKVFISLTRFHQFLKDWPLRLLLSIWSPFVNKENQSFGNCWNPVKDTKNFIKHHLFIYKKCMLEKNFKGVAQKLRLPRPLEAQN